MKNRIFIFSDDECGIFDWDVLFQVILPVCRAYSLPVYRAYSVPVYRHIACDISFRSFIFILLSFNRTSACSGVSPSAAAGWLRDRPRASLAPAEPGACRAALAGRDVRLFAQFSVSRLVRARAFMQCSSCRLPFFSHAEMAWIVGSCLQSRLWPGSAGVWRVVLGIFWCRKAVLWQRLGQSFLDRANNLESV